MPDQTLDYFLKKGTLKDHNAADIQWYHAANSKDKITEALQGQSVHFTRQNNDLFTEMVFFLNRRLIWSPVSLTRDAAAANACPVSRQVTS